MGDETKPIKALKKISTGLAATGTINAISAGVKAAAASFNPTGLVGDTFETESSGAASIISKSGVKTDLGKPVWPNQDLVTPPIDGTIEYQSEYKNPDEKSTFHPIKMEGLNVDPSGHISENNEPMVLRNDTIQLKYAPTTTAKSRGAMSRSTRQSIELPDKKPNNQ